MARKLRRDRSVTASDFPLGHKIAALYALQQMRLWGLLDAKGGKYMFDVNSLSEDHQFSFLVHKEEMTRRGRLGGLSSLELPLVAFDGWMGTVGGAVQLRFIHEDDVFFAWIMRVESLLTGEAKWAAELLVGMFQQLVSSSHVTIATEINLFGEAGMSLRNVCPYRGAMDTWILEWGVTAKEGAFDLLVTITDFGITEMVVASRVSASPPMWLEGMMLTVRSLKRARFAATTKDLLEFIRVRDPEGTNAEAAIKRARRLGVRGSRRA